MKKKVSILIHILFWIWFLFWPYIVELVINDNKNFLLIDQLYISEKLLGLIIFYCQYFYLLPKFVIHRQLSLNKLLLSSLALIVAYIILRYFIQEILLYNITGKRNYYQTPSSLVYFIDNIFYGGRYIMWATLLWLIIKYEKINHEKNIIQQEKNKAEVSFLQTQMNPHFLFNNLNNIYSLVYLRSPLALSAIQKMSQLMRYIIKDSTKDIIPLAKEVKYINSVIELYSLRTIEKNNVKFTVKGNIDNIFIQPLLLIPFIENGFKHGDISREFPYIINLSLDNQMLIFSTTNKIRFYSDYDDGIGEQDNGIGMENIQRRLELLYPNKYNITVVKDDYYYYLDLKINLK